MSMTAAELFAEICRVDPLDIMSSEALATALLPFIERHIAGQQGAVPLNMPADYEIDIRLSEICRVLKSTGNHDGRMAGLGWSRAVFRDAFQSAVDAREAAARNDAGRADAVPDGCVADMPSFQRWNMAHGSDGARWSVYMDHADKGEWVKWQHVQQWFFAANLPQQMTAQGEAAVEFHPQNAWHGVDKVLLAAYAAGESGQGFNIILGRSEIHAATEKLYTHPSPVADAEDAARYLFLREAAQTTNFDTPRWTVALESGGMGQTFRGNKLDAAIDAARKATGADHG